MITVTFIGSDKNAGKTTAFNHVYEQLAAQEKRAICLTATGISGDRIDRFFGHAKPEIRIFKNSCFVTAKEQLLNREESYEPLLTLSPPDFSKSYVFGRSTDAYNLILEGPNTRNELILMKKQIARKMKDPILMIDGSVDRQFVAHPSVTDGFYFSVLISENPRLMSRTNGFLLPLSLSVCPGKLKKSIGNHLKENLKSLLLSEDFSVIHEGYEIPFQDKTLIRKLSARKGEKTALYINGALSPTLSTTIQNFHALTVVLDNFTLYQTISGNETAPPFFPRLSLFHPVTIFGIFVRDLTKSSEARKRLRLPTGVPVWDLFRDSPESAAHVLSPFTKKKPPRI
jgi:hypothetical protein